MINAFWIPHGTSGDKQHIMIADFFSSPRESIGEGDKLSWPIFPIR